ncbi:MAG: hypothetical protein L0220_19060, partial [Acidobacteria bacterium]|nr:hypothetical protein [Acidobacteriota bacterium]
PPAAMMMMLAAMRKGQGKSALSKFMRFQASGDSACLEGKQKFVLDNTNITATDRRRYIVPARDAGFSVVGYYFSSRLEEALMRNRLRTGKSRIPDAGIAGMYKRLELPRIDEGFDQLFYVRIAETGEFIVEEWKDEL